MLKRPVFFLLILLLLSGKAVDAATDRQSDNQSVEHAASQSSVTSEITESETDSETDSENSAPSVQNLLQASRFAASTETFSQAISFLQKVCESGNDANNIAVPPLPAQWLKVNAGIGDSKTHVSDDVSDLIRRGRSVGKQFLWQSAITDVIRLEFTLLVHSSFMSCKLVKPIRHCS